MRKRVGRNEKLIIKMNMRAIKDVSLFLDWSQI